jgi:nucleotide-binding universal stress UspA family protein
MSEPPRTTSREIVVGVDGSPPSDAAVRWAARESVLRKLPLTLVHIVAAPVVTQALSPVTTTIDQWRDEVARRIVGEAADLVHHIAGTGIPAHFVRTEMYYSAAVPTLIELSNDAEMVVVGCGGHGTFRHGLAGSVSTALVQRAHCPVAVIHDGVPPAADEPVVVGINCSPGSEVEVAAVIAFEEAAHRGVGLIAVHAWSDSRPFAVPGLDWSALRDDYPDVRVRRVVVSDQSARHLAQVAENAQLLVVGSHVRGGFASVLPGSVGTTLAHCTRTPLIVARRNPHRTRKRRKTEKLLEGGPPPRSSASLTSNGQGD